MAVTITTLKAILGLDKAAFDKGVKDVDKSLGGMASKAKATGTALSIGLTAPLALLGGSAIKVAADFEQTMNVLQNQTKATGGQMAQMSKLAKDLGNDLTLPGTSASDAAGALLELSKGGLSLKDAMDAARPTLQLSAAAQIGNAEAAVITANALNAFQLSGDKAAGVADLLANAANASTGEITDMADALQAGGAVFHAVNIPINEAVTAISLLANAGIKGQDAGTSLKTTIIALANPTSKSAEAMKRYGISLFDAAGKVKPLRQFVDELGKSLGRMSDQQKASAAATVGGSDAFRALTILASQGAEGFDKMASSVNKAGGAADAAAAQNKGLKGAIDAIKSAFETAQQAAIEPVIGDLTELAKKVAELVGRFAELDPQVRRTIFYLAAGAAALGPTLIVLGQMATGLKVLVPAFAAARTAAIALWAGLTGPALPAILLVVAAIGLLVLAWKKNFGGIQEITFATVRVVSRKLGEFGQEISRIWSTVCDFLSNAWKKTWGFIGDIAQRGLNIVAKVFPNAKKIASDFGATMGEGLKAGIDSQFPMLKPGSLIGEIQQELSKVKAEQAAGTFVDPFTKAFQGLKDQAKNAFGNLASTSLPNLKAPGMPDFKGKGNNNVNTADFGANLKKQSKELTEAQKQAVRYKEAMIDVNASIKAAAAGGSEIAQQVAKEFDRLGAAQKHDLTIRRERLKAMQDEADGQRRFIQAVDMADAKLQDAMSKTGNPIKAMQLQFKGLTEQQAINAIRVDQTTASYEKIRNATNQAKLELFKLKATTIEQKIASEEFADELTRVNFNMEKLPTVVKKAIAGLATLTKEKQWEELKKGWSDAFGTFISDESNLRDTSLETKQAIEALGVGFSNAFGNMLADVNNFHNVAPEALNAAAKAGDDLALQNLRLTATSKEVMAAIDFFPESFTGAAAGFITLTEAYQNLPPEAKAAIDKVIAENDRLAKSQVWQQLAQSTQGIFDNAIGRLREGFDGLFKGIIQGFDEMLQDMARQFVAAQVTKLIFSALGADAETMASIDAGPIGGLFKGKGHAMGGQMSEPGIVGEDGPELFFPGRTGSVVSNDQLRGLVGGGGGGSITINQYITTQDAASFRKAKSTLYADGFAEAEKERRRNG